MNKKRGKKGNRHHNSESKDSRPNKRQQTTGTSTVDVNMEDAPMAEDDPQPVLETDMDMVVAPQVDIIAFADAAKEKGNNFYKMKDYKNALDCYSEAINVNPSEASYYSNRSACYMMLGRYKNALDDAVTCTSKNPNFMKGHIREAKCRILLGDQISALQALNRADVLEPGNSAIDMERRNCQSLQHSEEQMMKSIGKGEHRTTVYWCDQALKIASASSRLKVLKAEYLAKLKKYQESQEIVNDVLQVDNLNADAIYVRGLCLYYDDQVDKAFQHFQQTLRLAPDHEKAKVTFKMAKALKNKKEEGNMAFREGNIHPALNLYTEALAIDPANVITNSKLYCNRAAVNIKLGSPQEAIADCTKAIELDEEYLKAYMRRAKCYMDLEQYEEAVRDYEYIFKKDQTRENRRMLQDAKLELKKSKRKDYYKILGVDKNASEDDIKKAYRKRALIHHPDRHSSATEAEKKEQEKKFKDVGEAYSVLSDNKKRARYDQGQDLEDGGFDFGGGGGEFNPFNLFQATFGGGAPGFTFHSMGGEMPDRFGGFPGNFTFQFG